MESPLPRAGFFIARARYLATSKLNNYMRARRDPRCRGLRARRPDRA
jgi:hypothetical protein